MEAYSTLGWFAGFLFAAVSAFAAGAQEAITPINQVRLQRLEDEGMQRAKAIDRLLDQSEVYASSLLLLNVIGLAGAAVAMTVVAFFGYGAAPLADVLLALLLLFGLLLLQMVAKSLALRDPRLTARLLEGPLDFASRLLRPVSVPAQAVVGWLLRLAGGHGERRAALLNEEALFLMVGGGEEGVPAEESERAMITRIIELEDKTAHEIMVPRIDVTAVPAEATLAEIIDLVTELGHSRIPVYEGSIDDVVGILYVKDFLPVLRQGRLQATARQLARPAYFVPESKHVDELLRELRQARVHMAIVVDEYGGTAGLVTIEDLLEEIVGEIRDEFDFAEQERIQVLSEASAVFDGGVSVDDVNRTLGIDLATDGFDTIGGFVYHHLGTMAHPGDSFVVQGLKVVVLSVAGRRISEVKVERHEAEDMEADEPVEAKARGR